MEIIVKRHNDPRLAGYINTCINEYGSALVKVGKPVKSRTADQRRLQWFWNGMIGDEMGLHRDEVQVELKVNVLYLKCIRTRIIEKPDEYLEKAARKARALRDLVGTRDYEEHKDTFASWLKTRDLSTKDFSTYLDQVQRWALDNLNLHLPSQEDLIAAGQW